MNTKDFETELVKGIEFSGFKTVGELKSILSQFPDDMDIAFMNQPFQDLLHIIDKNTGYECLAFQPPEVIEELESVLNRLREGWEKFPKMEFRYGCGGGGLISL